MQPPELVHEIQMAMKGGQEHLLGQLPWMVADAIDKKIWTTYDSKLKDRPWGTFEAWVTHPLWEGLNSSIEELLFFCRKEPEVLTRIRAAVAAVAGHGGEREGAGRPPKDTERANQVRNTKLIDDGTDTATYALRRLKRDRPDLAEQVITGTLSANAAAIQAGFRKRMVSVPADPEAMARAIVDRYPAAARLIATTLSP